MPRASVRRGPSGVSPTPGGDGKELPLRQGEDACPVPWVPLGGQVGEGRAASREDSASRCCFLGALCKGGGVGQ